MTKSRTRFIKYSEPNDEPKEHRDGKMRVAALMGRWGYIGVFNADKWEFQLEPIQDYTYTLDVLMYNERFKRLVAVEINGAYHYASRKRIKKTEFKEIIVKEYFSHRKFLLANGEKLYFDQFLYKGFKTEEVIGKYALSDDEITSALC